MTASASSVGASASVSSVGGTPSVSSVGASASVSSVGVTASVSSVGASARDSTGQPPRSSITDKSMAIPRLRMRFLSIVRLSFFTVSSILS